MASVGQKFGSILARRFCFTVSHEVAFVMSAGTSLAALVSSYHVLLSVGLSMSWHLSSSKVGDPRDTGTKMEATVSFYGLACDVSCLSPTSCQEG